MGEIATIAQALRDTNPAVRRNTIKQLAQSDQRETLRYLAWSYKNDPDPELRQLAFKAGKQVKKQAEEAELRETESLFEDEYVYPGYQHEDTVADKYEALLPKTYYLPEEAEPPIPKHQRPYEYMFIEPPPPRISKPEPKARRINYETRQLTKPGEIAAGIVIFAFFAYFFIAPLSLHPLLVWVDLAPIPLKSGQSYGDQLKQVETLISPHLHEGDTKKFMPGYSLGSIAYILCQCHTPDYELWKSTHAARLANEMGGMPISGEWYPHQPDAVTKQLEPLYFISLLVWGLSVLGITIYSASIQGITFRGRGTAALVVPIMNVIGNFIGQTFGIRMLWLFVLLSNIAALFITIWFFTIADEFTPEIVRILQINVADGYHVGRQLGFGYWLTVIITSLSAIGAALFCFRMELFLQKED